MEFEDGGGVPEVAVFALAAFELDRVEVFEGFVELAGQALAVEAERRKRRDGRGWGLGTGGWGLGARQEIGLK
jgi:hypothetical protein